jgi:hypothetical protein
MTVMATREVRENLHQILASAEVSHGDYLSLQLQTVGLAAFEGCSVQWYVSKRPLPVASRMISTSSDKNNLQSLIDRVFPQS